MKLLKIIAFIGLLMSNFTNYSQFTDQINSNRPGKSAGAFSVGKNVYQIETGIYGIKENHKTLNYNATGFGLDVSARGGFIKEQLEFVLDLEFQIDKYTSTTNNISRVGLKQSTLGAKYLFYDPFKGKEEKPNIYSWKANHRFKWKQFIPAVSGYVGVNYAMNNNFNVPGESVVSPKIMVIAQNHFGSKWVLVTNLVADKITSITKNFGYIITITHAVNDKWSAFFENKAVKGNYYSDGILTLGATHLFKTNIQFDASISKNIKDTPSLLYGGIGCSYRFDKKHKDIKMENGKEVKEEKKKKNSSGVKTEEELKEAMEKAEKKKDNNDTDVDPSKPTEEVKKKRLDDIEEEKPEEKPIPEVTPTTP
jgi:Putative MetA-pathway of phenol degradation